MKRQGGRGGVWVRRLGAMVLGGWLVSQGCQAQAPAGCAAPGPQGYANSDGRQIHKPLGEVLQWMAHAFSEGLPPKPSTQVDGYNFPVVRDAAGRAPARPGELSATWIGHATVLLRIDGVTVLTDPHFSERAFAVQWAGPRRKVPLPYTLAELPHIDLVVISHNHYDHLDLDSVRALNRQPGGAPLFVVPAGLERWFQAQGIQRVQCLAWGEERPLAGLRVASVPVQHWSARSPWDRNATGWSGWVLRSARHAVYFAGDTGYSPTDFKAVGERYGGVDLALIPVGAYEPRWFMRDQHVDPAEAVQIHRDVRARHSIGIHWGTFELTDEPLDQPMSDLPQALREAGVAQSEFVLLKHGQTWSLR